MYENFLTPPTVDNLNIYEQIILESISEKEKIHNLAELDIKLNKMIKSNPSTVLKIVLFLLKHGELIINLGIVGGLYYHVDDENQKLQDLRNKESNKISTIITTLKSSGISIDENLLIRYGYKLILHLLNKYVSKMPQSANISEDDKNLIQKIVQQGEMIQNKISDKFIRNKLKTSLLAILI